MNALQLLGQLWSSKQFGTVGVRMSADYHANIEPTMDSLFDVGVWD